MKKYTKYVALIIVCFLLNICHTEALSCLIEDTKNLSTKANNVKVGYEPIDKSENVDLVIGEDATTYKIPKYEFWITLYNLTEDLQVEIEDVTWEDKRTIQYSDSNNGVYTFIDYDFGRVHDYVFTIKSAHQDCYGETIKTLKLTKPKYNAYSEFNYCQNSSIYYCQRFIASDLNINGTDDFLKKIYVNNEKNKPVEDDTEQVQDLIKNNWILYVGIFAGVVVVFVIVLIILKKRNKNKGWDL